MLRAMLLGPRLPEAGDAELPEPASPAEAPTAPARGWTSAATPEALRAAFDYRGEVSLTLSDGSAVEGYVMDPGPGELRLWTREGRAARSVDAERVTHVVLSDRDPAG